MAILCLSARYHIGPNEGDVVLCYSKTQGYEPRFHTAPSNAAGPTAMWHAPSAILMHQACYKTDGAVILFTDRTHKLLPYILKMFFTTDCYPSGNTSSSSSVSQSLSCSLATCQRGDTTHSVQLWSF